MGELTWQPGNRIYLDTNLPVSPGRLGPRRRCGAAKAGDLVTGVELLRTRVTLHGRGGTRA